MVLSDGYYDDDVVIMNVIMNVMMVVVIRPILGVPPDWYKSFKYR